MFRENYSYIYILTSKRNGTLYTGVTANLIKRVYEHKNNIGSSFTKKYGINQLVYYEIFNCITDAIKREKVIKHLPRSAKLNLIESFNPSWKDLYEEII